MATKPAGGLTAKQRVELQNAAASLGIGVSGKASQDDYDTIMAWAASKQPTTTTNNNQGANRTSGTSTTSTTSTNRNTAGTNNAGSTSNGGSTTANGSYTSGAGSTTVSSPSTTTKPTTQTTSVQPTNQTTSVQPTTQSTTSQMTSTNGSQLVNANGMTHDQYMLSLNYKYYAVGADGYLHGSNKSMADAQAMGNRYNSSESITTPSGVVFSRAQQAGDSSTGYVARTAGYGDQDVTLTYDPTTNTVSNVTYANNAKPTATDYVKLGDDLYAYYVDGDDNEPGWYVGTSAQYTQYVKEHNAYVQSEEEQGYYAQVEQMINEALAASQAANQAATDMSVAEIEAQLEEGLASYDKDAAEQYLLKLKTEQNQALNNAASGNTGGIGQKQYNDASAAYDAQLLLIRLEEEAFINECQAQIDQLEAQGRYNDAQLLAEWAQTKIQAYEDSYTWAAEYNQTQQQIDYNQMTTDREYAYTVANAMLEKGMLSADNLTALGVDANDAQAYADMINAAAETDLKYAKAQLAYLKKETALLGKTTTSNNPDTTRNPEPEDTTTYTVTLNDGTVVTFDSTGKLVNGSPKEGTYFDGSDGVRYYYNGTEFTDAYVASPTGEPEGNTKQRLSNGYYYSTDQIVKKWSSVSGDTSTKDLAVIKQSAQRNLKSCSNEMDRLGTQIDTLIKQYPGLKAISTGGTGGVGPSVPVDVQTKYAQLVSNYNKYDSLAGQWNTLVNMFR